MRIVGIDLAGSWKRDTGYCLLEEDRAEVAILHTDKEVLDRIKEDMPEIVGIDAPLSIPKERESIEEKSSIHFRECDLELRKLGIRFFPITLGPMRMLTKRGMVLKERIEALGIRVFEVYPGATYDLLKTRRKESKSIMNLFREHKICLPKRPLSQDELDAVCCAFTARLFKEKKAKEIGDPDEGTIIIPKVKKS